MKKVLVISTSLRRKSNSETLALRFAEGAVDAGNVVEVISLKEKNLGFCIGCLSCQKTKRCVIQDDAAAIMAKVKDADVLLFATPIYFYEMSGQMKTLLDRMNPFYADEYAFEDVYLLSVAADDDPKTPERAEEGLRGWISCFDHARFGGARFYGGINDAGAVAGMQNAIHDAYLFGRSIR